MQYLSLLIAALSSRTVTNIHPSAFQEFLKLEPEQFETMYQSSDCEFFQDLGLWCSDPAKEEQVLTIGKYQVSVFIFGT